MANNLEQQWANVGLADTLQYAQPDTTTDKLTTLQNNAQAKMDRFAASGKIQADISNYQDVDYTGPQMKHGQQVTASGVHDFNNQRDVLGELFRDAAVYKNKAGEKVTLQRPEDAVYGPLLMEDFNQTVVPKNKYGQDDTRNAYFKQWGLDTANTSDDINKFGLARNDLNDEAIAKGITPESARYMNQKEFWPYKGPRYDKYGRDTAYDGTPGQAVSEDTAKVQFDQEFLNQPITQYELNRYMDRNVIDARVAKGAGKEFEDKYKELGSGGTEYTYAEQDPLTNPNDPAFTGELAEGVMTPSVPRGYNTAGEYVGENVPGYYVDENGVIQGTKKSGYLGNIVDAAQYGVGSSAARVGDMVGDAISRVAKETYKALSGKSEEEAGKAIGKILEGYGFDPKTANYIALDKYKTAKEYGYDDRRIQKYVNEFKNTFNDPNSTFADKALVTLKGIVHGPEVLASSLGDIMLGMTGIPGMAAMAAGQTNEVLNQRAENKGTTDLNATDYTIATASGILYAAANMFTKGNVGLADAKNVIKEAASRMDKAALIAVTGRLVKDGLGEGLEEVFQGITEVVGSKLATPKQEEIATKETAIDLASQGALGFGGGVTGKTVGEAKSILPTPKKKEQEDKETKTTGITQEDRDVASTDLQNIYSKVQGNEAITVEDIARLDEIEGLMASIKDTPEENRKIINDVIKDAKRLHATQTLENSDDIVLKSKEDLMELMSSVYVDGVNEEDTDNKLYALASKAGIVNSREAFQSIKKDFYSVEKEATEGKYGYITLGKELKELLGATDPNVGAIKKKVKRLQGFKSTQEAYIEKAEKALKDAEITAADYNAARGSKIPLPKPKPLVTTMNKSGSKLTINFADKPDGTVEIEPKGKVGIEKILKAKKQNVLGITRVLSTEKDRIAKHVTLGDVDIVPDVVVDTAGVPKKLKKALEKTEANIKKNKINKIVTTSEAKRNDYINALIELNKDNVNTTTYEKDDNVLVVLPLDLTEAELKRKLSKGGSLYNTVDAIRRAGATVHLDLGKGEYTAKSGTKIKENAVRRLVREAFTRYGDEDTKYSPVKFGSDILKPVKESKEIRATKKAEKESKEEFKQKRLEAEKEALGKMLKGESVGKILKDSEVLTIAYKDSESATGVDKLKRSLLRQLDAQVDGVVRQKIKVAVLEQQTKTSDKKVELADEKDKLAELEANVDKRIISLADKRLAKREKTKGVLTEVKKVKEQNLDKEAEDTAIEEIIYEMTGDVKLDVLSQVESSGVFSSKGNKIPLVLSKFVSVKNKNSVLQVVPADIMFDDTLGIEANSLEYISDVVEYIKNTQKIADKDAVKGKTNTNVRDAELHDSPALGLVLDADGNVDNQVAMAMKLALSEYVAFNSNMIDSEYKSKADVAQMLGVLEGQIGPSTYKFLKDKGVFNKTAAPKVGKAVMTKLGLGFKEADGVEKELYDKLVADIGNMTLMYGKNIGILEGIDVEASKYAKARQADTKDDTFAREVDQEATIHFVRAATSTKNKEKLKSVVENYKVVHEHIEDEVEFERRPSRRPIKVSASRHQVEQVAKDITGLKIPEGSKDGLKSPKQYMEELVAIKWEVDKQTLDRITELDSEVLRAYLGYSTEEELDKLTLESRASAVSKNREIDKSIEEVMKLKEDVAKNPDKAYELYFDWFYSSNGRYMMESNTINPQTDKLHRFIVQPAEHKSTYVIKGDRVYEGKQDVTEEMNYALAQAFGYAVDKKSTDSITEIATKIKEEGYDTLKAMVYEGKDIVLKDGTKLEAEHIAHTMQALDVLQALEEGGEFTSSITAEYDAVTSGFGLKLMQFPILKDIWKWLNKVGVFKESDTAKNSMNDILAEVGFNDSYQELASSVEVTEDSLQNADNKAKLLWAELIGVLPKKAGDKISSELRTLFKDPFMTFNYSAGIASIKASLANKLSTEILDGITKGDKAYDNVAKLLAKYTGNSVENLVEELKTKPAESIKVSIGKTNSISIDGKSRYNVKQMLDVMMEATYGAQVEEIMTREFGDYIEMNNLINSSFKAMFDAFKLRYDEEKAKYAVGELSTKAFADIMEKLRNEFPLIKGPLSKSIEDGVAIYNVSSQNVTAESARYSPAQTKTGSDRIGERTLMVRHAIKDFEAAISAGSVVPIHYIDGALMAQIKGVTAIHDAIMPKLSKSKDKVKAYNKAMYNINKQYNLAAEVLDMLNRVDVKGIKVETQIKTLGEDGKYKYEQMPISKAFDILREELESKVDQINKAKDLVYKQVHSIGHMASMPGSMWVNEAEAKGEFGTIPNVEYARNKVVPWVDLTEFEEEINLVQSKETMEALIEAMNCKGNS